MTLQEVVYDWQKFRNLAHLERKYDETLTEYFKAFYYMIKRICRMVDQVSGMYVTWIISYYFYPFL